MSTASKTRYELFYFNLPARAEAIRFLLEYGKADWTERNPVDFEIAPYLTTVPFQNWAEEKPTTPFGCLPVLTVHREDGSEFQLGESHTIERYLARKFGLLGSNEDEAALIDSFCEGWATLINAMVACKFGKTEAAKEAGKSSFDRASQDILEYHEKQLAKNGNGLYFGTQLSLVDILAYTMVQSVKGFGFDVLDKAPGLNRLCETIQNHPVIGAYAQERLKAKSL
ncbi:glutathione S-transferase [Basidiobolus meristosporus CBS 931.73]|uniref:Glutathione S-transferase n=1 Tax=Basidiobolus meristosporus CBS 931.73 TaxID=1314790 RepID=A0A1Y1YLA4_9FUNG|nr:glutathione S-transferase [Basidiobolus meristosporus CBS 931.73]|eukprot:ORX98790.1 glutathione S-transferase [Basidiobolus meristosporus CBS 931.73]